MAQMIPVLRDAADYAAAMAEFEAYFDNEPALGSEDGHRFEQLGLLLAQYEEEHFPVR